MRRLITEPFHFLTDGLEVTLFEIRGYEVDTFILIVTGHVFGYYGGLHGLLAGLLAAVGMHIVGWLGAKLFIWALVWFANRSDSVTVHD